MSGELNLGLVLLPEYTHKGYAARLIIDTLELCFEQWRAHRVQALVMDSGTSPITIRKFYRM